MQVKLFLYKGKIIIFRKIDEKKNNQVLPMDDNELENIAGDGGRPGECPSCGRYSFFYGRICNKCAMAKEKADALKRNNIDLKIQKNRIQTRNKH